MIRKATPSDAVAICNIYNYYVTNTIVTFEEEPVREEEMKERILDVTQKYPWLVYEEDGIVIGYAYASAWKSRCSYKYSVESTVYLNEMHKGKGLGTKLYEGLLGALKNSDIHCVIGGIALPNQGSISLHEKFGFEKIAQFKQVGYKFNQWIDVGYWEKIL